MKYFKIQCRCMKINMESNLSPYVKRQLKLPDAALVHSYHGLLVFVMHNLVLVH